MRVLALLALCLAAVSAVPKNPQRIVGGSVTTIGQYPSMAALLFSWGTSGHRQACGGTILNNRSILTAAHCTIGDAPARWRIRVGSTNANSGGVVHNSQQIINHPNYNGNTFNNDVSIIRSSSTFSFNNNVRAASIAGSNYNLGNNQVVWATGWGTISSGGPASEQLRHVQIWTVAQNTCAQRYAEVGMSITNNMLCSGWLDVGGRDQCQETLAVLSTTTVSLLVFALSVGDVLRLVTQVSTPVFPASALGSKAMPK
ncbi:LOW QUALITY PROTEIN: achelase-1-like [Trichoplusia ni]|uniref:LOW QUALITY PROTEIN: achelase-1-like n=1 Tax=Trichoplusia ni TaxID=7111 RepID=A0A7E5WEH7_TRINI|nr:LOW QUALITY PROTEIN: achelase-1-like [Trichoplusia ni]